jgi:hypothetical protein
LQYKKENDILSVAEAGFATQYIVYVTQLVVLPKIFSKICEKMLEI